MISFMDSAVRLGVDRRLNTLRPDSPRRWGKMSAHQMICHLSDSLRIALGERRAGSATGLFQRTVMKWFALYVPLPWPHGIPTMPEAQQGAGGTPPVDFARDREQLIRLTERFCDPARDSSCDSHPLFGRLTREQWMRWAYLHADHHLRQFGV